MKLGETLGKSRFSKISMLPLVHSLMVLSGLLSNVFFIAISRFVALRNGKDIYLYLYLSLYI